MGAVEQRMSAKWLSMCECVMCLRAVRVECNFPIDFKTIIYEYFYYSILIG